MYGRPFYMQFQLNCGCDELQGIVTSGYRRGKVISQESKGAWFAGNRILWPHIITQFKKLYLTN